MFSTVFELLCDNCNIILAKDAKFLCQELCSCNAMIEYESYWNIFPYEYPWNTSKSLLNICVKI